MGKNNGAEVKRELKNILITFSLLFALFTNSFGQLQDESSIAGRAGASMRMGFGARGIAMGNAMTAVISGELQSYYNPAILPFQSEPTVAIAYGALSLDRRLNYLSYTKNVKPDAGLSLSIINAGVSDIDGRNRDGIHTQTYSTSENAFMLSFGLKPAECFSIGFNAKILYHSLYEGVKSTSVAIDFGAVYLLSKNITVGAVIQDLNAKYKWETASLYGINGNSSVEKFPLRKRLGISLIPGDYSLLLSGEYEVIGSASFLRVGSELEVFEGIFLRGGIDQIAVNTDLPAKPALGLSARTKISTWTPSFQYTYVFEPYSPSGIHILSLSFTI
jgi:hypothetical protein